MSRRLIIYIFALIHINVYAFNEIERVDTLTHPEEFLKTNNYISGSLIPFDFKWFRLTKNTPIRVTKAPNNMLIVRISFNKIDATKMATNGFM